MFIASPRRLAVFMLVAALATLGAPGAIAEPILPPPAAIVTSASSAGDAVERFLLERGLVDLAAPAPIAGAGIASRVRDKASDMVLTAMNFLGVRYRRGGTSVDSGFDCSGFTRQVFESSLGRMLPRRADDQAKAPGLLPVERDDLRPGDLVFFNTLRRTFSHVGIYVGEGKFIHAPRPGGEVRVEDMRFLYWARRFTGARRAEPLAETVGVVTRVAATATPNPTVAASAAAVPR